MDNLEPNQCPVLNIMDVLGVDLCARAILDHVPVRDLVRSERVCRRWQEIVRESLRGAVALYDVRIHATAAHNDRSYTGLRTVILHLEFPYVGYQAYAILENIGPFTKEICTCYYDAESLDFIISKCVNLTKIKLYLSNSNETLEQLIKIKCLRRLKNVSFILLWIFSSSGQVKVNTTLDRTLGELFNNIDCKEIEIYNEDVTGSFLQSVKPNRLKSLVLSGCRLLSIPNVLLAVHSLRNVTRLELSWAFYLKNMPSGLHLLLEEMRQLEELLIILTTEYNRYLRLSKETIESFGRLENLRRLILESNFVSDALLAALARCSKLEYLDISSSELSCVGAGPLTARGVAALCRRSRSAVTTLNSFILRREYTYMGNLCRYWSPVYKELAALCCVQLTFERIMAARSAAPLGRKVPFELRSACNPIEDQDPRHSLRIMVFLNL